MMALILLVVRMGSAFSSPKSFLKGSSSMGTKINPSKRNRLPNLPRLILREDLILGRTACGYHFMVRNPSYRSRPKSDDAHNASSLAVSIQIELARPRGYGGKRSLCNVVVIGGTTKTLSSMTPFVEQVRPTEEIGPTEEIAHRLRKIFPARRTLLARPRFPRMRIISISKFLL